MPKIIGEPIPSYAATQINQRQRVHGKTLGRTPEDITYLNSKTAWVKLASGVTIDPERIRDEYFRGGNQGKVDWATLAQRYVLFGGTSRKEGDTLIQRGEGVNGDGKAIYDTYTGVYNVNADANASEFGLQPMPGVISADIQCLTRGSIKKATVKIKCYTPEQFHILDLLYLRIGYTIFLEWGNSLYLDNGGNLSKMDYTLVESPDGFFSDTITPDLMYDKIEEKRREKSGNYDGLLGRVVNFNWVFAQDGSYDITLEILSRGDVVESLKTNITPNSMISSGVDPTYTTTTDEQTSSGGSTNSLSNNIITAYLQYLAQSPQEGNITIQYQGKTTTVGQFVSPPVKLNGYTTSNFTTETAAQEYIKVNYPQYTKNNSTTLKKGEYSIKTKSTGHVDTSRPSSISFGSPTTGAPVSITSNDGYYKITEYVVKVRLNPEIEKQSFTGVAREERDIIHLNYENSDSNQTNSGYYIRFGHLLEFIHDYVLPYQYKSSLSNLNRIQQQAALSKTSMINIESGKYNTKMLTMPYQVSLDPRVCIVSNNDEEIGTKRYFWELEDWKNKERKGFAYTMNIYVSHDTINDIIHNNVDEKNNLSLFEFLNTLCQKLNVALGNINTLEPVIDEEENTLYILDQSYSEINPSSYGLELYGYNKKSNSSTFVRNISLKTEITPAFAEMASIGSTAAGYVKGVENTMFSKWNHGLYDRLYNEFVSGQYVSKQEQDNDVITDYLKKFYWKKQPAYGYLDGEQLTMDANIIDNNISVVSEFYRYCHSYIQSKEEEYSSPTNGFIPINLGVTMDGMSGIKIYNELKVSTKFLPDRYPESLHFIVKGVNHKLSNSDWETNIETITIANSGKNGARLTYNQIKKYIDELLLVETKDIVKSPSSGIVIMDDNVPSSYNSPVKSTNIITLNKTIQSEYIPIQNKLNGFSKGIKLLAQVMTQTEGFYPGSPSYRTNNPGNIGGVSPKTLELGIKKQLEYLTNASQGNHNSYILNIPKYLPPSKQYPGYRFTYTGKLKQFIKIYAEGARNSNNYLSNIISYFIAKGYKINENTTMQDILNIK